LRLAKSWQDCLCVLLFSRHSCIRINSTYVHQHQQLDCGDCSDTSVCRDTKNTIQ
jgi:hypothetical protein